MLRAIPGVSGNQLKYVMGKVESLREFVELSKDEMIGLLGEEGGKKAWQFIHLDSRRVGFGGLPAIGAARSTKAAVVS
jgi:DNA excision repair protein ERCC-4